jgi:hypothetical protein
MPNLLRAITLTRLTSHMTSRYQRDRCLSASVVMRQTTKSRIPDLSGNLDQRPHVPLGAAYSCAPDSFG